jgi:glycosyltransferase involved in cell wall biosynthesis
VDAFDSVGWAAIALLPRVLRFVRERRPDVLVLVCWTPWTLPIYLTLAAYARKAGGSVVVDLHDPPGPGGRFLKELLARRSLSLLIRAADRVIVHDEFARGLVTGRFAAPPEKVTNIAVAPQGDENERETESAAHTFLYFGGIDDFKGVADLVRAFDAFSDSVINTFRLRIVGTVHGEFPLDEIVRAARHRERITIDSRWVPDDEVDHLLTSADVVVFPYRRQWSAWPLDVAIRLGKQVVVTRVGGVATRGSDYTKRTLAEPANIASLTVALERAARLSRDRIDPHRNWPVFESRYLALLATTADRRARLSAVATGT